MKNSTSQSLKLSGNDRLRLIFKEHADLSNEIDDAELFAEIASTLYRLRKEAGILQKTLASELDVQQSNISRYETPGYSGYTVKMLRRYVRKLNADLEIKITKKENTVVIHTHIQPLHNESRDFEFIDSGTIKTHRISLQSNVVTTITKSNPAQGVAVNVN